MNVHHTAKGQEFEDIKLEEREPGEDPAVQFRVCEQEFARALSAGPQPARLAAHMVC